MFKLETHLHTKTSSPCGWLTAQEIMEGYRAAGYSGICVTDHYLRYYFEKMGIMDISPQLRLQHFLKGYYELMELSERYHIHLYRGAEVRFDGSDNDFLVYGLPDELLLDANAVFSMGVEKFSALCRECGALLVQAHPYRDVCLPVNAELLDGVEIYNGNPRAQHFNRNDLAMEFAQNNRQLLRLSGSDCHRKEDIAGSGIVVEHLPKNEMELVSMIKRGQFTCIMP